MMLKKNYKEVLLTSFSLLSISFIIIGANSPKIKKYFTFDSKQKIIQNNEEITKDKTPKKEDITISNIINQIEIPQIDWNIQEYNRLKELMFC